MADIVDIYFRKMGWSDDGSFDAKVAVVFNYCELAVTLFFCILTYMWIIQSTGELSLRLFGVLWLFLEMHIFVFIIIRIYQQSQFRDMYQRSLKVGIPENYRRTIAMVIKFNVIIINVLVTGSMLYMITFDSVKMGDPFTFPFVDVLPIKTTNVTVYVCKYIIYALPVYISQFEACFLNVTFMYSTGVVKRHFQILDESVEEAIVSHDEQKLKIAILHHVEVLKYFTDMSVFEISILLAIELCALYFGLTSCFTIQAVQGLVHPIILGLCITSLMTGLVIITVYCIYASSMYDLHDGILSSLFEHQSCYSPNKSFKQLILMMMTRATIPLEFRACSIFTINLNLLVKILKFAYAVFNLLFSSINRQFNETAM